MKIKIGIVGLGYVGLPLAIALQKYFKIDAYDSNLEKIKELRKFYDRNDQFSKILLKRAKNINYHENIKKLENCNIFILAVPTPVSKSNKPDLSILKKATLEICKIISKGDTVIYESTVYPGVTEEVCVPIIEAKTKLKLNKSFFCGYSPERINPGDDKRTIEKIVKITSGSNKKTLNLVDKIYKKISKVGTYKTESIKVAEAAKVIENAQRDINIAFINELSIIFSKLNIDTKEVLDAAKSKWNFLNFQPGLVGGHCIGVDPYYLTFKSKNIGYFPKVILSGRKINEKMGLHIVTQLINKMKKKNIKIKNSKILLMGLTFKENCSDIRNSGVKKVFLALKRYKCKISLYDPVSNQDDILKEYNTLPLSKLKSNTYDAIVVCVAHDKFKHIGLKKIRSLCKQKNVIYDLKYLFNKNDVDLRL